jgi:hypothetical protein
MKAVVGTADGVYVVDLDTDDVEPSSGDAPPRAEPLNLSLPRVLAAARAGSTIVAAVDSRPPLIVSHDAGRTWRDSGRGLPPGRTVAIAEDNPDLMVFATRNRLYVSVDGGRFWQALAIELPEIETLAIEP